MYFNIDSVGEESGLVGCQWGREIGVLGGAVLLKREEQWVPGQFSSCFSTTPASTSSVCLSLQLGNGKWINKALSKGWARTRSG